jgi:hypothetical protein
MRTLPLRLLGFRQHKSQLRDPILFAAAEENQTQSESHLTTD